MEGEVKVDPGYTGLLLRLKDDATGRPCPVMVTEMQATTLREGRKWDRGDKEAVRRNPRRRCFHETTEYLGSGGSIVYRRCTRCGDVVLAYSGHAIAIPSR